GSGGIEANDARAGLRPRRNPRMGERGEINRRHRAADEHIAWAVARDAGRTDENRTATAEKRRPHEARIDHQRPCRIATVDVEAVVLVVDLSEPARHHPPAAVS